MEPDLWVVAAAVAAPFAAAALVPVAHRWLGERVAYLGALAAAVSFGLVASQLGTRGAVALPWIPARGIALRFTVDGLSVLFALLASGIGVLVFAYAARYMHDKPALARFYAALSAFLGSILGVAFAADLIALFLFWELTSVCSFVLIGYHTDDPESRYAARMAMLVTVGGGLCLLAGIAALAVVAGPALGAGGRSFDLAAMLAEDEAMRAALAESGLLVPVLVLVTVAAAAKSAQVPLHFWLPNAMVAPTPVSAFLHSATMVKVGVYVLGRFRPLLVGPEWTLVVATLGLVTMLVCAALAVVAADIKELLAYSTASHLGLMVAGFGFRVHYGPEAGAFHLLNHALFKAALFLVAGVVAHQVGTRQLSELGGLRRDLPVTAVVAAVAGLSMAGVPPLPGFYSKELLFEAAWDTAVGAGGAAWLFPVVATLASAFTVLYSLRFVATFFGSRPGSGAVARPSPLLVAPPAVLAALTLVVGLAPGLAVDVVVGDAAAAAAIEPIDIHVGIPTALSGPVAMSGTALAAGVVAYPVVDRVGRGVARGAGVVVLLQPSRRYARLLGNLEAASTRLDARVHDGRLRTYVTWVLATTCLLALGGYLSTATALPRPATLGAPAAMVLVLGVAAVAALAVTTAPSHVAGVLTLGILGFMIAVFYVLASGPDLALTQLVVETLLLLVFLLVIEELPAFYEDIRATVALRDAALSTLVGATAFVSVLVAVPDPGAGLTDTARFYVDNAVPGGGGTNVVNVVLTDFRALDTLGELAVVALAAVSVLVLLTMRTRGETG